MDIHKLLAAASAALACTTIISAQTPFFTDAQSAISANLDRAGNNISPYEPGNLTDTPAPDGFRPFYITHYGRHGSRSDYSGPAYREIVGILTEAKDAGMLTAQGDSLLDESVQVMHFHDGMDGRLTARGRREHTEIAGRMFERFPEVFAGKPDVRVVASTSPRCLISMACFTNELTRHNPAIQYSIDAGEKLQLIIDPTHGRGETTRGAGKYIDEVMAKIPDDSLSVLKVIFKDPGAAMKIVGGAGHFTDLVWKVGITSGVFDMEHNANRFLSKEAILRRWAENNLDLYINHCNSEQFGKARISLSKPAIDEMVAKADEAINGGKYAADLRFGHDFAFLAIVSYLGVEGHGDTLPLDKVCDSWFGFKTIQMASNIQGIFYRNAEGTVIVKFLLQEEEVTLRNLTPYAGPYYRWDEIKDKLYVFDR